MIRLIINPIERFAVTASCFTCIPLGSLATSDLSGLSKYLPTLGLVIGVMLSCAMGLMQLLHADRLVAATLTTMLWLLLTRAVHFDGLMDAADGLLSHRDRNRMLEIMRDSRVGNFGVMVGVGVILLKVVAINSLPQETILAALVLVPAAARFCEVYTMGAFPYLRSQGMGKVWHDTTRFPRDLILAAIVPVVVCLIGIKYGFFHHVLAVLFFTVASGIAVAHCIAKTLGGHTGDTYGATTEFAEASGLLLITIYCSFRSVI